jgi:hypothetical protein
MRNPFYPGDKVKYKDGDDIYIVYAVYSDEEVSLGLQEYPDIEQDYRTNINNIELVDKYTQAQRDLFNGGPLTNSEDR